MPQLLMHIDQICRKVQRDVLFARFTNKSLFDAPKWEKSKLRSRAIAFAESRGIAWQECAEITDLNILWMPYCGSIFFDVPVDEADPQYRAICSFFEDRNGTPRFKTLQLYILQLELAMKYAFTDEPGFWVKELEKW